MSTPVATPEDVLTEALDRWRTQGWYQGPGGRGKNGEACLVHGLWDAGEKLHATRQVMNEVCRAVYGLLPSGSQRCPGPIQWNDAPTTAYEDVVLLVEQARADLKVG